MGPARTGKDLGAFQFDRVFPGVGRIKRSSGTTKLREFRRRDALLTKLFETSALDVLRAFKTGHVSIEEIVAADRGTDPVLTMDRVALHAPLWAAVEAVDPRIGKSAESRTRFLRTWRSVEQSGALSPDARVGDLATVDWVALEQRWGKSAADWNHVRRAVSRFLTLYLRDKWHPVRRQVMHDFPTRKELARVPDQNAATFLALVNAADAPLRPCYLAIALTGMRVGEYIKADASALLPAIYGVRVTGKSGEGVLYVDPEVWPVIEQAIPCPIAPPPLPGQPVDRSLRYGRLRRGWLAAQKRLGVSGVRIHDLRHLFGQLAADANVPTVETQAALRHADMNMTRRYEMRAGAKRAAAAVAQELGLTPNRKKA
jgi:integrase